MKTKADMSGRKPARTRAPGKPKSPSAQILRDAAWKAEKKWFQENRPLDSLSLFAKYFQRLG